MADENKAVETETAEQGPIQIDLQKVERLQRWIILKENQNIKSGANKETDMIKAIKKRIEEEVNAATVN